MGRRAGSSCVCAWARSSLCGQTTPSPGPGAGAEVPVEQEGACQAAGMLRGGRLHSSRGQPGDTGMITCLVLCSLGWQQKSAFTCSALCLLHNPPLTALSCYYFPVCFTPWNYIDSSSLVQPNAVWCAPV